MMGALHVYCAGANIRDLPGKYVDSILLNVVDNFATESLTKEAKRILECASPRNFMLDNGGYPLLKAEEKGKPVLHDKTKPINYQGALNLTPHHVIEVVRKIWPHDFVASDFPVQKLSDRLQQQSEFKRKLEINVPWAIESAELRQRYCPEAGLFVSIQCYNIEQLEVFLKAIDGIQLNGFSMPTRTLKLPEIALFMIRFYQLGIRRVHLLGVTEFFTLALAAYMSRHFFDWVSLDSRTWKIRATYSQYLNPHDLMGEELGNNVIIDAGTKTDCSCPWCKDRTFNYMKHLPYKDKRTFLGCHNHWAIEKAGRDLYQNSRTIAELERYLRLQCRRFDKIRELIDTLYLIDTLKDRDIRYLQECLIIHS
jgi:queuine/archaeosine tRNA-ribosyltransferase